MGSRGEDGLLFWLGPPCTCFPHLRGPRTGAGPLRWLLERSTGQNPGGRVRRQGGCPGRPKEPRESQDQKRLCWVDGTTVRGLSRQGDPKGPPPQGRVRGRSPG